MTKTSPKKIQKCPKIVRKCPKHLRKCVPNIPQNIQKIQKNTITNNSRSCPESNPAPSGSDSGAGSVSQPTGLIPPRDRGSPELSYVSELDKNTHRNYLVAEMAFDLFFRSKKHFSEKQALYFCEKKSLF